MWKLAWITMIGRVVETRSRSCRSSKRPPICRGSNPQANSGVFGSLISASACLSRATMASMSRTTFDQASFGGTAVSGADVRQRPHHALHDVAMALDETGKQDLVLEPVIEPAAAGEACEFGLAADRDDPALAHGDVGRKRPRWVHGYDLACRKDGRVCVHPQAPKLHRPSLIRRQHSRKRQMPSTNGASPPP